MAIDLVDHVQMLVEDLRQLRRGEIGINQAKARAILAREATRAMILLASEGSAIIRKALPDAHAIGD